MGANIQNVYEAFLARIESDEWLPEDMELAQRDWRMFLTVALSRFKFPRPSLSYDEDGFFLDAGAGMDEMQVLACFMRAEWINRCIASWTNIRMLYSNRDFSQANHLDKLLKLADQADAFARQQEHTYYRSPEHKSYPYRNFAGGGPA